MLYLVGLTKSHWYYYSYELFRIWLMRSPRSTRLTSVSTSRRELRLMKWKLCTRRSMLPSVPILAWPSQQRCHQRSTRGIPYIAGWWFCIIYIWMSHPNSITFILTHAHLLFILGTTPRSWPMSRGRPASWKGSTPSTPLAVPMMMMRMTSEVLVASQ